MVDCGVQLIVGYGLGISTMAVVWAFNKMRLRHFVRGAMTDIKKDNIEKEKRIEEAKQQIIKAKQFIEESEQQEAPKQEVTEEQEPEPIVETKPVSEVKPKQKRTFFKKKNEEPEEKKMQSIRLE